LGLNPETWLFVNNTIFRHFRTMEIFWVKDHLLKIIRKSRFILGKEETGHGLKP
jgi:hypothetical protein